MTGDRRRPSPRLVGVALVAIAAAALAVALTGHGEQRAVKPVASARGILRISNSREGQAILGASGIAPGDSAAGEVTIRNESSARGALALSQRLGDERAGIGGGRLYDALQLEIRQPGGRDGLVYSGPMAAMGPTALAGFSGHESRTYDFAVSFPDGGVPSDAFQGSLVSVDYTWSARLRGASRLCRYGVLGSRGDDVLAGSRHADRVLARGGDDLVRSGPGSDCVYGGTGDDRLIGGRGADRLRGGYGDDLIRGGPGADRIRGRQGDDLLIGGPGPDSLRGTSGDDLIVAADGQMDRIHCGIGDDTVIADPVDRVNGCERIRFR